MSRWPEHVEEPGSPPSHASEDLMLSSSSDNEGEEPHAVQETKGKPCAVQEPGVEQRGQLHAGG